MAPGLLKAFHGTINSKKTRGSPGGVKEHWVLESEITNFGQNQVKLGKEGGIYVVQG